MTIHRECADELLCTTRAVRKRLDFARPVSRQVILACIRISQQAPTASNSQNWRWLVVADEAKKRALAGIYHSIAADYFPPQVERLRVASEVQTERVFTSAAYLADNLHRVPALVFPCLLGRPPEGSLVETASFYASIYPAVWSFNLALRARGLGTVLTTFHLVKEREAAAVLGIPDDVTQVAMLPVAYTIGDSFAPADRPPPETITSFDQWPAATA